MCSLDVANSVLPASPRMKGRIRHGSVLWGKSCARVLVVDHMNGVGQAVVSRRCPLPFTFGPSRLPRSRHPSAIRYHRRPFSGSRERRTAGGAGLARGGSPGPSGSSLRDGQPRSRHPGVRSPPVLMPRTARLPLVVKKVPSGAYLGHGSAQDPHRSANLLSPAVRPGVECTHLGSGSGLGPGQHD